MIGNLFQSNSSEVFYFNINGFLPNLEMDTEEDRTPFSFFLFLCSVSLFTVQRRCRFLSVYTLSMRKYRYCIVVV